MTENLNDAEQASLLELLGAPACVLDGAGIVIHLNAYWRDYLGLDGQSRNEQLPWTDLISADSRSDAVAGFEKAVTSGERVSVECQLSDARGIVRWFLVSISPLVDSQTQSRRWLCTTADIHESKLHEIGLEERAAIQTEMLNVSLDCIKLIGLDGTLRLMNRSGCRALGVSEESSFGMEWLPLLPADVRPAGQEALATARLGRSGRFPGRSLLAGRPAQHWDNLLTPIAGDDGLPTAILCVSREVTAEHLAMRSLHQSQARLKLAAQVGGLDLGLRHQDR